MTHARRTKGMEVIKLFNYVPLMLFFSVPAYCVDLGRTGAVKGVGKNLTKVVETAEAVSTPSVPSGPASGNPGTSYSYTTGGGVSRLGHVVEYRFDWGDGTYSSWGTGTSASHSWSSAGTYQVKAEARCGTHTGAVSGWSGNLTVSIAAETVSAPTAPTGPATGAPGTSYTYTTGGANSSLGHPVEYRFDWGDSTFSTWAATASASYAWTAAGTYSVKAQARCATHTANTAVSTGLSMAITALAPLAHQMVLIPAGTFSMGSNTFSNEQPIHVVNLDAFYIDKYEVTFDQYDRFCDATGRTKPSDSGWGRGTRPVIDVSWNDAKAYCDWAGKRLPTEAEWEYACRAGGTGAWTFGDTEATLVNYAWYGVNSGSQTHPVGEKTANAWGLYDMHGNVWEWCADWYDSGYYAGSPATNPPGPASGTYRLLRGGSCYVAANDARSAYRGSGPGGGGSDYGFRCAASP